MYTLYKETWYMDNSVEKKHVCEKMEFESIEKAREEMKVAYEVLSPGNSSSLLLKNSFIICKYGSNGLCARMITYGILGDEES